MLHNYFTIGLTHLAIARKKTLVDFKYIWDGKLISTVPSTTYSGLHVADNLCWNEHDRCVGMGFIGTSYMRLLNKCVCFVREHVAISLPAEIP